MVEVEVNMGHAAFKSPLQDYALKQIGGGWGEVGSNGTNQLKVKSLCMHEKC